MGASLRPVLSLISLIQHRCQLRFLSLQRPLRSSFVQKFDLIDFDIWPESRRTPTKTLTAGIRVLASGDASVDNSTVPRMVGDAEGVAVANRR